MLLRPSPSQNPAIPPSKLPKLDFSLYGQIAKLEVPQKILHFQAQFLKYINFRDKWHIRSGREKRKVSPIT